MNADAKIKRDDGDKALWIVLASCGGVVLLVLLAAVCSVAGFHDGVARERLAAAKAGVGQWTVDKTTGATRFVYGRAGDGN